MELKMMSLVLSMAEVESVDSFADDERDANVSDADWHATKRVGGSSDASDGKKMMMTNASDPLRHR